MMTNALFNRYSISSFDFKKAIEFANEMSKYSGSSLAYESLLTAAIICYSRPFSQNEKGTNSLASAKLCELDFQPLTELQSRIHFRCIELRNKAIAHSEYLFNPTKHNIKTATVSSAPFALLNEPFELSEFLSLADHHLAICHEMRANYLRRFAVNPQVD